MHDDWTKCEQCEFLSPDKYYCNRMLHSVTIGCPYGQEKVSVTDSEKNNDIRPLVLCRDCVYAYPFGLEIKCTKHSGRTDKFGDAVTYSEFHDKNWFCADGEHKR